MTSEIFDQNIQNVTYGMGGKSLEVLKCLLNEGTTNTFSSDIDFTKRVLQIIQDPDSIWNHRNGVFLNRDEQSNNSRDQEIHRISTELNLNPGAVRRLIIRVTNTIKRRQHNDQGVVSALRYTYPEADIDSILNEES